MKNVRVYLIALLLIILGSFLIINANKQEGNELSLGALVSLPYVGYVEESESSKQNRNVTIYTQESAYTGLNLYNNHFGLPSGSFLIDMEGNLIHKWVYKDRLKTVWRFAELEDDGSLIVLLRQSKPGLIKLDWESNLIFGVDGTFHHDVSIMENGDIYALSQKNETIIFNNTKIPIWDHYITIISNNGKIIKEISLYNLFKNDSLLKKILSNYVMKNLNFTLDLFHANTIEILENDISWLSKKGNLLISVRNLNTIAIMDVEKEKLIWSWGKDELQAQHKPTLLENGNMLIFDNGNKRKYSRVIELNVSSGEIIWRYIAEPPSSFFTEVRGSNQRLLNGNILITESDTSRVFEINHEGKIVWEWFNPYFNEEGARLTVYRMDRFDYDFFNNLTFNYGVVE